ncbi:MAG: flagellar protein FlaG [Alkaliphilus sp.]
MKVDGVRVATETTVRSGGVKKSEREEKVQPVEKVEQKPREEEKQYNEKQLKSAIESANKTFAQHNRHFQIAMHDRLNQVMVKVIDSSTDEVIREIPSSKLIDMVANMLEVAGLLMDDRA